MLGNALSQVRCIARGLKLQCDMHFEDRHVPSFAQHAVQISINWCICKGTLPIPGAKDAKQLDDIAGAIG